MLKSGDRLGAYEIVSGIGVGGMGEVYKARDIRLERTVALKVLPAAHAADMERRLRFEREARAISSLSHPHICALYDIGEQNGVQFLVMEFLEGETLEERLRKGVLPLDEALDDGIQIAGALDQAHRHGIIHRDLKPGNVMLTKNGVKLLDFGLAKVLEPEIVPAATSLPTVAQTLTARGTIMGTYQYMAPEQLEGADADVRSDIFAFGALMYEMVTGRRAFQGKSQASLISAIMSTQPQPMSVFQPMVQPALEHVVSTCLAKDPDARWQTSHDVLVQLKWIAEGGSQLGAPKPVVVRRKQREHLAWAAAAILLAPLVAISWLHFREAHPVAQVSQFAIPEPEGASFSEATLPLISPDGRTLAFTASSVDGKRILWVRRMGSLEARSLPGTEGVMAAFWSPDSRFIAFTTLVRLYKIDIAGGPPIPLCSSNGFTGTWNRDGVILMGASMTVPSIRRVSSAGGEIRTVLSPEKSGDVLIWPSFLPDGRHFLYESRSVDGSRSALRIGSLDSQQTTLAVPVDSPGWYAPPGYLLFVRQSTIFALPFDAAKLRPTGEAVPLAEGVGTFTATGYLYSVSQEGSLVYRGGNLAELQIAWFDRSGKRLAQVGDAGQFRQVALSPDGKRAALERRDIGGSWDIWVMDLTSGILSRVTSDPADDTDPVWSPDSRQIAFASSRRGHLDLYRKTLGAPQEELVYSDDDRKVPEYWLKEGAILYTTSNGKNYFLVAAEGDHKSKQISQVNFNRDEPSVSPDGKWISYNSLESGRWEVYLASFPSFAGKQQISRNGGAQARWRGDSRELYFLSLEGKMMAVDLKTSPDLEAGVPRELFDTHIRVNPFWDQYGVTADGQKFLFPEPVKTVQKPIVVMLNWPALLHGEPR